MSIILLNKETLESRKKAIEEFRKLKTITGIDAIDGIFDGGVYKGSLYCITACRGVGKTTFLLAMAKKLSQTMKVLYVSYEQEYYQLASFLPDINENLIIISGEPISGKQLIEVINEYNIEAVCYDYIGATLSGDWDDLVREADQLANVAKETKVLFFTAAQADDELFNTYKNNKNDPILHTGRYLSFSKHMADKFAGAAYLLKDGTLICYKNRYGRFTENNYVLNMNYETKDFIEWTNMPPFKKIDYNKRFSK